MRFLARMSIPAGAIPLVLALPVSAATAQFADTSMDPADYTVFSRQSVGGSFSFAQTATGGNPGAGLVATYSVPAAASAVYRSTHWLTATGFSYDPASQGTIQSISWSIDTYFAAADPNFHLRNLGATVYLQQGGNYYRSSVSYPLVKATFQTASRSLLVARDFNLITDTLTLAVDPGSHPNFSSGLIKVGFVSGISTSPGSPVETLTCKYDNFTVSIAAVP